MRSVSWPSLRTPHNQAAESISMSSYSRLPKSAYFLASPDGESDLNRKTSYEATIFEAQSPPQVLNGGTMPSAMGASDTAAITFADPALGVPSVLFFMGANGMGKTTTVGKVSSRLREEGGQKVLLAAADTFRCATVSTREMQIVFFAVFLLASCVLCRV